VYQHLRLRLRHLRYWKPFLKALLQYHLYNSTETAYVAGETSWLCPCKPFSSFVDFCDAGAVRYQLSYQTHVLKFLYKLHYSVGISTTDKNLITITWKFTIIFSRVWDSQSAADMLLALFSAMNEFQRVLILKRQLSRLLLLSKMFTHWKTNTCLLGDMEILFAC